LVISKSLSLLKQREALVMLAKTALLVDLAILSLSLLEGHINNLISVCWCGTST
jgi:hypothetical protein